MNHRTNRQGFTLIELMVVLVILGLIAGIGYAGITFIQSYARKTTTESTLRAYGQAVKMYQLAYNSLPQKLTDLAKPPKGGEPLIELKAGELPKDGYGRDYVYKVPGKGHPYDLYSYGPKGPEEAAPEEYISVWNV